jgi:hypothetical protein
MAEIKAFTGKAEAAINRDWAKDIAPKGSRLIAYIDTPDIISPEYLLQSALFHSEKGDKLIMYHYNRITSEPNKTRRPRAALKSYIEGERPAKITSFIPRAELEALFRDEALTKEQERERQAIEEIPGKLMEMRDKLQDYQDWNKLGEIDQGLRIYTSYLLADIAAIASELNVNLLAEMDEEEDSPEGECSSTIALAK